MRKNWIKLQLTEANETLKGIPHWLRKNSPKESDMTREQMKEFEPLAREVIKWLNNNCHPHVTVIIDQTGAEILEGLASFPTTDYLKD